MSSRKIVTPEFRVSFPSVFQPTSFEEGSDKKFEITMLFPKETDLKALKELAREIAKEKWGEKFPKNMRKLFRDGDEKSELPGYSGHIFVKAISNYRPGLIDKKGLKIVSNDFQSEGKEVSQEEFYAGCWARAALTAYAYGGPGTKFTPGVSFNLNNLQKMRDDEPFGNRSNACEDFGLEKPAQDDNQKTEPETEDDIPF